MKQTVTGTVEHIVYQNAETGYAVIELGAGDEYITVVGLLSGVSEGEEITAEGEYVNHPSFGLQFKAESCEYRLPDTATAILKYLSSGVLPGIGPIIARRIVEEFGADTFNIIEKFPDKLARISGLNMKKAEKIQTEFHRIFGVREAVQYLSTLGVTPAAAIEAYRSYGDMCVQLISENIYLLCSAPIYMPFEQVDRTAAEMDMDKDSTQRLAAGILYVMQHNLNNGHTCLPKSKLMPACVKFLETDSDRLEIVLSGRIEHGDIISSEYNGEEYLFLPEYYRAEMNIAAFVKGLAAIGEYAPPNLKKAIQRLEITGQIKYAQLQKKAIETALSNRISVLTGGPGTGKTTTVNAIIELLEQSGDRVALAAPTGRAAKRMAQLTGRETKTIHRLLEVDYMTKSDRMRFVHNNQNKLKYDAVIVDEMSMVDCLLFSALCDALKPSCRLILVGDFDQLPSVGPGNVLKGITESGIVPITELKEIFRQAAKSLIVTNAHRIVNGQMPQKGDKTADFFFMETPPGAAQGLVLDLAAKRLPESYGFSPVEDIQVLCATKIGEAGSYNLNRALQQRLNPPAAGKPQFEYNGQIYRLGDKVMQIKNNYDIVYRTKDGEEGAGAFNGDIGIVEAVDSKAKSLVVRFDDRIYNYATDFVKQLDLAYAVTVHKSQGCEFSAVVMPISEVPEKLCYRNLLYTGVTRAKSLIVLVGQSSVLRRMVENDKRTLRFSCLTDFILDDSII